MPSPEDQDQYESELQDETQVPSEEESPEEEYNELCEEIETQFNLQEETRSNMQKWLKYYEAEPHTRTKTFPWMGASNVHVGLSSNYVDQVVARIMQAVFSSEPHWVITQLNRAWAEHCKPLERWLDWLQSNLWDQYREVKRAVLETCKVGTGLLVQEWVVDTEMIPSQNKGEEPTQSISRGVKSRWLPREDFLMPLGFIDPQTAPWIGIRHWFSRQQVERLISQGFFEPFKEDEWPQEDEDSRIRLENDEVQGNGYRSVDLYAFWQVYFAEDKDKDGFPEDNVVWLHPPSKTVVKKCKPNRYGCMRPVTKMVFVEKEGEFDGMGIPEMVWQYQEEISTDHNQRADNKTIANIKMIVARRGAGISQNEKVYPGKILFVNGNPKEEIMPWSMGEVYPSSADGERISQALAEARVGINDVNSGNVTPPIGRATATTMMQQLQEGTRRFDLNTSEIRRSLGEQGLQILEMYQIHGVPKADESGAPEQMLDPEDANRVREILATTAKMRGLVRVKLNISTAAVNKEIEKQSAIQLYQMVVGHYQQMFQILGPMLAGQMPQQLIPLVENMLRGADKLLNNVFQAHARFDLESVLISEALFGMKEGSPNGPIGAGNLPAAMAGNANGAQGGAPNGAGTPLQLGQLGAMPGV